jgi:hypothetical protein
MNSVQRIIGWWFVSFLATGVFTFAFVASKDPTYPLTGTAFFISAYAIMVAWTIIAGIGKRRHDRTNAS